MVGFRSDGLELAGNEPIKGNNAAFAVRMSDGSVASWGHQKSGGNSSLVESRLKNVKALCATWGRLYGAFAAIVDDGKVVSWGDPDNGGSPVAGDLTQVVGICGSTGAFAALKRDGTVTTWGNKDFGGDSSLVRDRLKGVKAIYSTYYSFAAVLHDGSVEAWGGKGKGSSIPSSVKERLKQVQCICGSYDAFAALLSDGTVETWGDQANGGDSSKLGSFTDVVSICASRWAFAALKKDGTVVSWGAQGLGGDSSRVTNELKQVMAISSTAHAFAALRSDGSVVTWGDRVNGGDSSKVAGELKEVVDIRGTEYAFAALRSDGSVTTWGDKGRGGDSSAVRNELVQVVAIGSTSYAFAARRSDGTVVTWGDKDKGGDSSSVPALRLAGAVESKDTRLTDSPDEQETGLELVVAQEQQRQELEQERNRLKQEREGFLRERELWQKQREDSGLSSPREVSGSVTPREDSGERWVQSVIKEDDELPVPFKYIAPFTGLETNEPAPRDGSVEFWLSNLAKLREVLDEEDMAEVASKFSAARFRQRHVGKLSQNDLVLAKIAPAVMKDFMDNQHLLLDSNTVATGDVPLYSDPLPRIPEEELTMEEVVGEGAFSVVWRATWKRKILVGKPGVSSMQVAVKMQTQKSAVLSRELTRDLAVISSLPHQNILISYGVCESRGNKGKSIVYELMNNDLAKLLKESLSASSPSHQLLPTHMLLRVLRDVSAGLVHLHSHGVLHRDVKPANVLLRDEQVKLCDFGSSRDLKHTIQQMSVAGTLSYMSPEMLNQQPTGRPADVWSFGVLLFECVTGLPCGRAQSTEELVTELSHKRKCLPALVQLFVECHQADPQKRPSMHNIHIRLQQLVMLDARDSHRLREELKRAEAQDKETYDVTWNSFYGNQPHSQELLEYLKQHSGEAGQSPGLVLRQPLKLLGGKGSMEELEQLATDHLCSRLHTHLKAIVEECGGAYLLAARKFHERCVQKVEQEYEGDYGKLLDLERATGLFEHTENMLRCLKLLMHTRDSPVVVHMGQLSPAVSSSSPLSLRVVRCEDRMNKALPNGYRDILLNVCEVGSGFIMELQLNFHKIAQIKSQSHRFYELIRVMELKPIDSGPERQIDCGSLGLATPKLPQSPGILLRDAVKLSCAKERIPEFSSLGILKELYGMEWPHWQAVRDRIVLGLMPAGDPISMHLASEYFKLNRVKQYVGFVNCGFGRAKYQLYEQNGTNRVITLAADSDAEGVELDKLECGSYHPKFVVEEAALKQQLEKETHRGPWASLKDPIDVYGIVTGQVRDQAEPQILGPVLERLFPKSVQPITALIGAGPFGLCSYLMAPRDEAKCQIEGARVAYEQNQLQENLPAEKELLPVACLKIGMELTQWAQHKGEPFTFLEGMSSPTVAKLGTRIVERYRIKPGQLQTFCETIGKLDKIPAIVLQPAWGSQFTQECLTLLRMEGENFACASEAVKDVDRQSPPSPKLSCPVTREPRLSEGYDVVIKLDSLTTLIKRGRLDIDVFNADRFDSHSTERAAYISVHGHDQAKKAFLLSLLSEIPCGLSERVEGIGLQCIKPQNKTRCPELLLLDVATTNAPYASASKFDRLFTGCFIRELVTKVAHLNIVLVDFLDLESQQSLDELAEKRKDEIAKGGSSAYGEIVVVHNFMELKTTEDIEKQIQRDIMAAFDATPEHGWFKSANFSHVILAQQDGEAGARYNSAALDILRSAVMRLYTQPVHEVFKKIEETSQRLFPIYLMESEHKRGPTVKISVEITQEENEKQQPVWHITGRELRMPNDEPRLEFEPACLDGNAAAEVKFVARTSLQLSRFCEPGRVSATVPENALLEPKLEVRLVTGGVCMTLDAPAGDVESELKDTMVTLRSARRVKDSPQGDFEIVFKFPTHWNLSRMDESPVGEYSLTLAWIVRKESV